MKLRGKYVFINKPPKWFDNQFDWFKPVWVNLKAKGRIKYKKIA